MSIKTTVTADVAGIITELEKQRDSHDAESKNERLLKRERISHAGIAFGYDRAATIMREWQEGQAREAKPPMYVGIKESVLAEILHTAWRKGTDTPSAMAIHRLISDLPDQAWGNYVSCVNRWLYESGWTPWNPEGSMASGDASWRLDLPAEGGP